MPAAAKYRMTGDPIPPTPTTRTDDSQRDVCPDTPMQGKSNCREYRSTSVFVSIIIYGWVR